MLLVLTAFFAPVLGPKTFIYRDTGRLHSPVKRWMADELRHGRFPQWNPYEGLGMPVVASAVDAPQHPFQALVVLWPEGGLEAWILLCYALAAFGAVAWARSVGLRWSAAAVAGVAFALSGPLVSASDNVQYLTPYATLPWVLAALHRWLVSGRARWLAAVAGAGGLCAAGGDPQSWGLLLGAFVPYALVFAPTARGRAAGRALVALLAVAVASAPFILPVALWLPHSVRASGLDPAVLQRWNLHPARLLELWLPGIFRREPGEMISPVFHAYLGSDDTPTPWFLSVYLGVSVLALAAVGMVADRRMRHLLPAIVAALWAALGPFAGFERFARHVPVLHSFRYWEKVVVWVALIVALAAGAGVAALLERGGRRMLGGCAVASAALLAAAGVVALWPAVIPGAGAPAGAHQALTHNVQAGALHAGAVLGLLAVALSIRTHQRYRRLAPLALAAVVVADLFGGNGGAYVVGEDPVARPPLARDLPLGARVLTPFLLREDRWPERGLLEGTWEWGRRTLATSWNVPLRVTTPTIYTGLRDERWSRLQSALDTPQVSRLGLFGYAYMIVPGKLANAASAGIARPEIAGVDPELPAWLVRVPHRPRAYLAGRVRLGSADAAFQFALRGGEGEDDVVLEDRLPAGFSAARGTAQIIEDQPGAVRVETVAGGPALLVLNDAFAPGWTASVDGHPVAILRANWDVRAVLVPGGAHQVRFEYQTPGLLGGWLVALAGAAALAAWALLWARRPSARPA